MHTYSAFIQNLHGIPKNSEKEEELKQKVYRAMNNIENYFLNGGSLFVEMTYLLQPLCALTQLWMTDYKPYKDGSKVDTWIKNPRKRLQSHFDTAHKKVTDAIERGWFN